MGDIYFSWIDEREYHVSLVDNVTINNLINSTTVTAVENGTLGSEIRYTAFGETRWMNGVTVTDQRYTGQRNETEIGLYFYVARWYDPFIGKFIFPDSIIPNERQENSSGIGNEHDTPRNNYVLVVDYHEHSTLEQLNKENLSHLRETTTSPSFVPTNLMLFDRYSYAINNPIKLTDPSGHGPETPLPGWLPWLKQNVQIIWRDVSPGIKQFLFVPDKGTRIFTVDPPHGGRVDYWHINSELKALQFLNHKNIEPIARNIANMTATIQATSKIVTGVVKETVSTTVKTFFPIITRAPFPIIFYSQRFFTPPGVRIIQ